MFWNTVACYYYCQSWGWCGAKSNAPLCHLQISTTGNGFNINKCLMFVLFSVLTVFQCSSRSSQWYALVPQTLFLAGVNDGKGQKLSGALPPSDWSKEIPTFRFAGKHANHMQKLMEKGIFMGSLPMRLDFKAAKRLPVLCINYDLCQQKYGNLSIWTCWINFIF